MYLDRAMADLDCRKYNSDGSETPAIQIFRLENLMFLVSGILDYLHVLEQGHGQPGLQEVQLRLV